MTNPATDAPPLAPATKARVLVPFALVTFIWGSTWLVIRDQLGVVPPSWSVSYRFITAAVVLFAYARAIRAPLRMTRAQHGLALVVGLCIFMLNFNFVYRAEGHITSGLVAVMFALLIVPNSILGWAFLKQGLSRAFLGGSLIAMGGVGLLFAHELHAVTRDASEVVLGMTLTLIAVLFASIANVLQASAQAKAMPTITLLTWSTIWGALANILWAWISTGPPVFEPRLSYIGGILYLGVIASALAFMLYFDIIRAIGPARAAYSNTMVPIMAMALSTVFEGYRWSVTAAVGGVLVLVGLVIALRAKSTAA